MNLRGLTNLGGVQSEDWSGGMGVGKEESQEDTGSVGSRCLGIREKRRINQEGSVNSITQIGR